MLIYFLLTNSEIRGAAGCTVQSCDIGAQSTTTRKNSQDTKTTAVSEVEQPKHVHFEPIIRRLRHDILDWDHVQNPFQLTVREGVNPYSLTVKGQCFFTTSLLVLSISQFDSDC